MVHFKWCTLERLCLVYVLTTINCWLLHFVIESVDVQYNVITYHNYLFFFCLPYLIISIKIKLTPNMPLSLWLGLLVSGALKGTQSQVMHPHIEVFDWCPLFTKILTYHNNLSQGGHHVTFINICLDHSNAPHAFISSIKPVWSVIALEGAHVELRTLEGHCVIYLSLCKVKYWLITAICFGLTYCIRKDLLIIISPICLRPIGPWCL